MPESSDQRLVLPPTPDDLRSICHLFVTRRRGLFKRTSNNSSGVLLGNQYVLTAAHNVYSTRWSKVLRVEVSVGHTTVDSQGAIQVSRWRVADKYYWRRYQHDYAVLKLPEPLDFTSRFQLAGSVSQNDLASEVRIAGYPGESGGPRNGKNLHEGVGKAVLNPASDLLRYTVDTEQGNSGGPAWIEADDGTAKILGVHVYGDGDEGVARVANTALVDQVQSMIKALN